MSGSKRTPESDFIKSKLGRTSAKLVQSFKRHMKSVQAANFLDCNSQTNFELCYNDWIKKVDLRPRSKRPPKKVTVEQIYRVIENIMGKLDAEKEAHLRTKDKLRISEKIIKQLENDLEKLNKQKERIVYLNPPAMVAKAMAVFGD